MHIFHIILLMLVLSFANCCKNKWNYWWINDEWKPMHEWYSIVTIALGIIFAGVWWIGTTTLWYFDSKYKDKIKPYRTVLDRKTSISVTENKLQNNTIESILKQRVTKITDETNITDTNLGLTYKGRNLILSGFDIPTNNMWSNKWLINKLKRFKTKK